MTDEREWTAENPDSLEYRWEAFLTELREHPNQWTRLTARETNDFAAVKMLAWWLNRPEADDWKYVHAVDSNRIHWMRAEPQFIAVESKHTPNRPIPAVTDYWIGGQPCRP